MRVTAAKGHKETYSTASPHDRCTFDCGRSREAGTRRRGRATVMPIIAGLRPNNDALRDLPPPPQILAMFLDGETIGIEIRNVGG